MEINIDVDNLDWLEESIAVPDTYVTRKTLIERLFESYLKNNNQSDLLKENKQMKKVIKEEEQVMPITQEQKNDLMRQIISIQTSCLKLFEFVDSNMQDKGLTNKVSKIVSYMEEFRNFVAGNGENEASTKVTLEGPGATDTSMSRLESKKIKESVKKKDSVKVIDISKQFKSLKEGLEKSNKLESSLLAKRLGQYKKKVFEAFGKEVSKEYDEIIESLDFANNTKEFNECLNKMYVWGDKNKVKFNTDPS